MLSIPDALDLVCVLLDVADMVAEGYRGEVMMSSKGKGLLPGVGVARERQRNSGTHGIASTGRLRTLMACNLFWRGRITRLPVVAPPAHFGNDSVR